MLQMMMLEPMMKPSIPFLLPTKHGQPVHYQGEADHKNDAKELNEDVKKEAPHSVIATSIEFFKYLYSTLLPIFSAAIFSKQIV
jgi:hypothetical protein